MLSPVLALLANYGQEFCLSIIGTKGDASLSLFDPLSVELPEGVTFSQTTFPMTYAPTPGAVPEPPTLWLLGAGLLGLAWVARRRRAAIF